MKKALNLQIPLVQNISLNKEEILLKEIPPEYTEELKYYKGNGYLTSTLILNTTMVFMEELLKPVPVDGRAVQRIIAMGAHPEDAAVWKQAYEDHLVIEEGVKEFNKICWPDIKRKNDITNFTSFRFICDDCILLSLYTAGRILMTIGPKVKGINFVSVIGDGTQPKGKKGKYHLTSDGKYNRQSCGLQGVHAKKDEAIKYINSIMSNWDVKKYRSNRKKVSIC